MDRSTLAHTSLVMLLTLATTQTIAESTHSLEDMKSAAIHHVKRIIPPPEFGELSIKAGYLDPRLKRPPCSSPLSTRLPGKQTLNNKVTVLVECHDKNWQVYIPITVRRHTPIVVATRPLNRGDMLTKADLTTQLVDVRHQRGQLFINENHLIGAKIKKGVKVGEPIEGNDICMVCKDDNVTIRAQQQGLNIVTKGIALNDGTRGEQIKVRNNHSNRELTATITSVGNVVVRF